MRKTVHKIVLTVCLTCTPLLVCLFPFYKRASKFEITPADAALMVVTWLVAGSVAYLLGKKHADDRWVAGTKPMLEGAKYLLSTVQDKSLKELRQKQADDARRLSGGLVLCVLNAHNQGDRIDRFSSETRVTLDRVRGYYQIMEDIDDWDRSGITLLPDDVETVDLDAWEKSNTTALDAGL